MDKWASRENRSNEGEHRKHEQAHKCGGHGYSGDYDGNDDDIGKGWTPRHHDPQPPEQDSNKEIHSHTRDDKLQQTEGEELWTTEYLVDQLFLCLAGIRENTTNKNDGTIPVKKYYSQARRLMKWIPIARPVPEFILQDLFQNLS